MSSDKRTLLLRVLQERLVSVILQHGFDQVPLREVDQPSQEMRDSSPFGYFRRAKSANLELLEIQLDKRDRPRFILNLGVIPPAGVDVAWGHFAQDDAPITAAQDAYRLHPKQHPGALASWFTVPIIGLPLDLTARTERTVDAAVALLPEVEEWFARRVVGPHMRRYGYASHTAGLARNA